MGKSESIEHVVEQVEMLKMDGLSNILRSKNVLLKLFWLATLVSFVCVCVVLVVGSVVDYLQYEVSTKTRLFQEQQAVFPTFTLCQVNPFSTDRAIAMMANANATKMQQLELYAKSSTGAYLSDKEKQEMSDLDSIILSCVIGNVACSASDFEWIWHPTRHNCYRYNSGRNMVNQKQDLLVFNIPGILNFHFMLVLYSGLPNAGSALAGSSRGFYLYVHNSTEYPFNASPAPLLLTPGFGTHLNVQREFYSQFNEWPYAYSDCRVNEHDELLGTTTAATINDADEQLFEKTKRLGFAYSRDTCLLLCVQTQTVAACKCNNYNISMRAEGVDEWCLTDSQVQCAYEFFYEHFTSNDHHIKECLNKCPLECHRRILSPIVSYVKVAFFIFAVHFKRFFICF